MPERIFGAKGPWRNAAYVAIALSLAIIALAVWNITLVQEQERQQEAIAIARIEVAKAKATVEAQTAAASAAKVAQCFARVDEAPDVQRFLRLIEDLARNTTKAKANLALVARFKRTTTRDTPTEKECKAMALELKVDPQKVRQETAVG